MIQIYREDNTGFDSNGDAVLDPISCEVTMYLNGTWEMELVVPLDSMGKHKLVRTGAVISAPTPAGKHQLYRIYEHKEADDGVTALARPIFLDAANDVMLVDTRPTNCNGQTALDILTRGTKYRGKSDITSVNTAYYIRKNLIEALASDDENSFLNRWGGEIAYDNYTVEIHKRQGADRGLRVEFGRNVEAIRETENREELATRLVPESYNGHTLGGSTPWVDSPRIGNYPIVYTKTLKCEDIKLREDLSGSTGGEADIICDTLEELQEALRKRCEEQFAAGVDLPLITYDVSMIDLTDTQEYAEYKALERVALGDTVYCYHRRLGIETKARVIQIRYDCIRQTNKQLVLGDYKGDYFSRLADTGRKMDELVESITRVQQDAKGAVEEASKRLNDLIAKASGLYSSEQHLPDGSTIYLLHDRPILEESHNVIKLTSEAIGFSTDGGKSYPYGFTITGEMVAALLEANGVIADWIIAGTISDKSGKNFWDLDTGQFSISAGATVGGKTVSKIAEDAAKEAAEGVTTDFSIQLGQVRTELTDSINGLSTSFTVKLDGIETTIEDKENGLLTKIEQSAEGILQEVSQTYATGESVKSQISQSADSILSTVSKTYATGESVDSKIEQSAEGILQEVSQTYATGESVKSQIKQSSDSILSTVSKTYATGESVDSKIEQSAGSILSEVSEKYATGERVSKIEQTASDITQTVSDLGGNFSQLQQTVEGFTYLGEGGKVMISNGSINLTGAITWSDFDTTAQGKVDTAQSTADSASSAASAAQSTANTANTAATNAKTAADNAKTAADKAADTIAKLAKGEYSGGTFINGTTIYGPTIYSNDLQIFPRSGSDSGKLSLMINGYIPLQIKYLPSPCIAYFSSPAGGAASWDFEDGTNVYGEVTFNDHVTFSGGTSGIRTLTLMPEVTAKAQSDTGFEGPSFEGETISKPASEINMTDENGVLRVDVAGATWYLDETGWHK